MSVHIQGNQVRSIALGIKVSKATGTLTAATTNLFTVSGLVAVTSLVGRVTTAVTVANATFKLQHNPTLGTSADIFAATDIGTTDSAAGEIFVVTGLKTDTLVKGALGQTAAHMIMDSGVIEQVSGGTDGALTWILTYVPIDDGASVVAA